MNGYMNYGRNNYRAHGYAEDPYLTPREPLYNTRHLPYEKNFHPDYSPYNEPGYASNIRNEDPYGRAPINENIYGRKPRAGPGYEDKKSTAYEVEHLATFTIANTGQDVVVEAMEKLEKMSTNNGIWTMQCLLVIEPKYLVILDRKTEECLENFPLRQIECPKAVNRWKNNDRFSNIVLFIAVGDDIQNKDEMHIFQAVSASAERIVDEVFSAKDVPGTGRSNAPFPPAPTPDRSASPLPPSFDHQAAQRSAFASGKHSYDAYLNMSGKLPNEFESSTEQQERNIQLLNHCFDDIEKFAMKLKNAAEAFNELEVRNKNKGKKGRRGGNGMLTMRAKPPPPQAFIDIFVKFKLTFNLLASLKPYIHDPNAPELVHFVFSPLSLVVDAIREDEGEPRLARKVISPLLSPEAKELLNNCLSSKELDLWQSLGPSWALSSMEWNGDVTPVKLRFYNGWEPSPAFLEEFSMGDLSRALPPSLNGTFNRNHNPHESSPGQRGPDLSSGPRGRDLSPGPRGRDVPPMTRGRDASPNYRAARDIPPRQYDAQDHYSSSPGYVDELQRKQGYGRNEPQDMIHRNMAPAPHREVAPRETPEYARPLSPQPQKEEAPSSSNSESNRNGAYATELLTKGNRVCKVLHSRVGKNKQELTVTKEEILEILDDDKNWWQVRNKDGAVGYSPYTILKVLSSD